MKIDKIKISIISYILLALSALVYALRGNYGAILITLFIITAGSFLFRKELMMSNKTSLCAAIFVLLFAVVIHYMRSVSAQYYLIIGYVAAIIVLLESNLNHYNILWKCLKGIAIFEALGVYLQFFFPNTYYAIISKILSSVMISSIRSRQATGYYTGFTHEVSFTMFLVVAGLGLYLFDPFKKKNKKNLLAIVWLLGSLVLSGKRASLLFFFLTYALTLFILSKDKGEIIKFATYGFACIVLVWVTYPWWGQFTIFDRVNIFINDFKNNDLIAMSNGRLMIYNEALQLWKSNKLLGIGWGNFKYLVSDNVWYTGFDVHNCPLQVLCETGIVGLAFYVVITTKAIINSISAVKRSRNTEDYGLNRVAVYCCYMQMFFVMYSMTEPILYEYTDYILYFACFNCSNLILCKFIIRKKLFSQKEML